MSRGKIATPPTTVINVEQYVAFVAPKRVFYSIMYGVVVAAVTVVAVHILNYDERMSIIRLRSDDES